jgi:hypothetical protein
MAQQDADWAGAVDITETDVALVASLFNDCIAKIDPFRFQLDLRGDFTMKPWYKELVTLIRLMNKIEAKPRLYIQAQITEYRKPCKSSREVPTIKMMTTPAGVDRYQRYLERMGMTPVKYYKISHEEMADFSKTQMEAIMKRLNIPSEQEFFKDPYLVAQLSKSYVKDNPVFQELAASGFYQKKFGIAPDLIFP